MAHGLQRPWKAIKYQCHCNLTAQNRPLQTSKDMNPHGLALQKPQSEYQFVPDTQTEIGSLSVTSYITPKPSNLNQIQSSLHIMISMALKICIKILHSKTEYTKMVITTVFK